MPKYLLSWTERIRCSSVVTAKNKDEAIGKAGTDECEEDYTQDGTAESYIDLSVEEVKED